MEKNPHRSGLVFGSASAAVLVLVLCLLSHGPQGGYTEKVREARSQTDRDRWRARELLLFEAASEDCPIGAGPMDMDTWSQGI